jgi:uroporphyrinogen decarboxylase
MALMQPERFRELISTLVEASARYLIGQIEAGANVVKIFDSWAGILDDGAFETWAVEPVRAIVEQVRAAVPGAKIIAFPKGAGARLGDYAARTGVDAVAVDWTLPMRKARELVPRWIGLQGNLDPLRVVVGGRVLDEAVDAILAAMDGSAHIFNLGHGITPDAPLGNVARLVERVRRTV